MVKKTLLVCLVAYFIIAGIYIYWINKTTLTYRNYAKEKTNKTNELPWLKNDTDQLQPQYVKDEIIIKFKSNVVLTNDEITAKKKDQTINSIPEDIQVTKKIKDYLTKNNAQSYKLLFTKIEANKLSDKIANIYITKFNENIEVDKLITELQKLPEIEYAQPNYVYHLDNYQLNDPLYLDTYSPGIKPDQRPDPNYNPPFDYMWNLKKIKLREGLNTIKDDSQLTEVRVAVIDTGVDYTHPEFGACTEQQYLANQCSQVLKGYNYIDNNQLVHNDTMGHGTHVAGTIAAISGNNQGIAAFHNKIKIIPFKVLGDLGGTTENIVKAIYDAATIYNAQVINMSFGSYQYDRLEHDIINDIYFKKDVVFVAAAGNDDMSVASSFPASYICYHPYNEKPYDCVVTVGSSNENDTKSSFSNYGFQIDVVAPGGGNDSFLDKNNQHQPNLYLSNIISLKSVYSNNDQRLDDYTVKEQYMRLAGTSMATPHVSGLAALIKMTSPSFSSLDIRNAIINGADDIETEGFDIYSGYGRINVEKTLLSPNANNPPVVFINKPINGYLSGDILDIYGTVKADKFSSYRLEWASADQPNQWHRDRISYPLGNQGTKPVIYDLLGIFSLDSLPNGKYFIKLTLEENNKQYSTVIYIFYDHRVKKGWPFELEEINSAFDYLWNLIPIVSNINNTKNKQIVFETTDDLFVLNHDGNQLFQWNSPNLRGEYEYYSWPILKGFPIISELNQLCSDKCQKEIIFSYLDYDAKKIEVLNIDGNRKNMVSDKDLNQVKFDNYQLLSENVNRSNNIIKLGYYDLYKQGVRGRLPAILIFDSKLQLINIYKSQFDFPDNYENPLWIAKVYTADIDGNGVKEIIMTKGNPYSSALMAQDYLFGNGFTILKQDGSLLSDWSVKNKINEGYYQGNVYLTMDSNSNKYKIITAGGTESLYSSTLFNFPIKFLSSSIKPHVAIYNYNGTLEKYIPLKTGKDDPLISIGDYNYDGNADILVIDGNITIYDLNGKIIASGKDPYRNFPAHVFNESPISLNTINPVNVVSGDIDSDGYKEFIKIGYDKNNIPSYFFYRVKDRHVQANVYPMIPAQPDKYSFRNNYNYAAIDDINNDGKTDFIFATQSDFLSLYQIYVIELGTKMGVLDWPQYMHDEQHTGFYEPGRTWNFTIKPVCNLFPTIEQQKLRQLAVKTKVVSKIGQNESQITSLGYDDKNINLKSIPNNDQVVIGVFTQDDQSLLIPQDYLPHHMLKKTSQKDNDNLPEYLVSFKTKDLPSGDYSLYFLGSGTKQCPPIYQLPQPTVPKSSPN